MNLDELNALAARAAAPIQDAYQINVDADPVLVEHRPSVDAPWRMYVAHRVEFSGAAHTQASKQHTVMLGFRRLADGQASYRVWCGDEWCEGRCDDRRSQIGSLDSLEGGWMPTNAARVQRMLEDSWATSDYNTPCHFGVRAYPVGSPDGLYCKHCKHVLELLVQNQTLLPDLPDTWDELFVNVGDVGTGAAQQAEHEMRQALFVAPVMVFGERSARKSTTALALGPSVNAQVIEYGCHSGSEPADFIGYPSPWKDGYVWLDGPVGEAFRRAQAGERIVLVLDEILRARPEALNVLLSLTVAYAGFYHLRTGRVLSAVDGVGTQETLRAPVANLAIVGTTNMGGEVDAIDLALKSRFRMVHMPLDIQAEAGIILTRVMGRGWSRMAADRLVTVLTRSRVLASSGLLSQPLDLRGVIRAVDIAPDEAGLRASLWAERMQVAGITGQGEPVAEHLTSWNKALANVFNEAPAPAPAAVAA